MAGIRLTSLHRPNAPTDDAAKAVQNFLQSLQGNQNLQTAQLPGQGKVFTTLPELLPPSTTIPVIDSADDAFANNLLSYLPPVLLLNQEGDGSSLVDPSVETAQAVIEALSLDQKKDILRKTLRSPQFSQSLGSLTQALRDGGLPSISDALKIPVANGGFIKPGSGVPMDGGDAMEAFVKGVKTKVESKEKARSVEGEMETD